MKYQKIALLAVTAAAVTLFGFRAVAAVPVPAVENAVMAGESGQQILPSAMSRSGSADSGGAMDGVMRGEEGTESGMMGGIMEEGSEMLSEAEDNLMSGDGALGDTDDRDGQVDGTSGESAGDGTESAESSSGTTGDDGMSIWGIVIVLGVIAAAVILLFALMPKRRNGM